MVATAKSVKEIPRFRWAETVQHFFSVFSCQRCGVCCIDEDEGIILLNKDVRVLKEIVPSRLQMSYSKFKDSYTFSEDGHRKLRSPCVFYKEGCVIYHYRPAVCRFFPLVLSKENRLRVDPFCPGAKKVMENNRW